MPNLATRPHLGRRSRAQRGGAHALAPASSVRPPQSGARASTSRFARRLSGNLLPISDATQQRSMLMILLATCERALEAFQAADNPLDRDFVVELERVTERTRGELERFATRSVKP
jgi:hypothetical protein